MKKKVISIVAILVLVAVLSVALVACNKANNSSPEKLAKSYFNAVKSQMIKSANEADAMDSFSYMTDEEKQEQKDEIKKAKAILKSLKFVSFEKSDLSTDDIVTGTIKYTYKKDGEVIDATSAFICNKEEDGKWYVSVSTLSLEFIALFV